MPRDTSLPPALLSVTPYPDADAILDALIGSANLDETARKAISAHGARLVKALRAEAEPGLMESFLAEYGLSTDEGIALMCLAEALLRVPDAETIDELIEDKIAPGQWSMHLGKSSSAMVNASTWGLMFTGKVLDDDDTGPLKSLRRAVKRLGEPVIRRATSRAMKIMGKQFVLGEDMTAAMERASKMEEKGYTYSYDMLGEAALTFPDAERYRQSYEKAIGHIALHANSRDVAANPGISVKLSALHPRYEIAQRERVLEELVPVVRDLAARAAALKIGFNIDAEEQDRLTLSLEVIEEVLKDPRLSGWDGFGIVVQAYGPRAGHVIDWIAETAERLERKIMVRLVKGAYWDAEIKRAQQEGMDAFPVFERKAATDVSYISNARRLLTYHDRIYPQFATHNAHTIAAVLHMADEMGAGTDSFEFQRLHGMGEALYDIVRADQDVRCRIYAPVGAHRDLLAYLVRRLLENGANSSFVNQIVDEDVPAETVAADPFERLDEPRRVTRGPDLFAPERRNSRGWDLTAPDHLAEIDAARMPHRNAQFEAGPMLAVSPSPAEARPVMNPANPADQVGIVHPASEADVAAAMQAAVPWGADDAERARVLNRAADLYEQHFGEIFALLSREAGKTVADGVAELREAVDFLTYYAARIPELGGSPLGRVVCISPWNFPLAIFTGQIAAGLAAGNAVLAKPAEQTTLIAALATRLLHEAGVPQSALQLLPGSGAVGGALTSHPDVAGVAFTGSTATARKIQAALAEHARPGTPLIAETGGLNAMIVDSTALPEQAVRDLMQSAFQSAGQRCSACRCLYVQEDIAEGFITMLKGAMDAFSVGDPWLYSTDSGPLIDGVAHEGISAHVAAAEAEGRLLHRAKAPETAPFLAPALIKVNGIGDIGREIFGPVLHVATFKAADLDRVIDAINGTGYGLTFGLHTRIDDRVQHVTDRIHAGNIYVNRNQIGAIVGSQPFGGEGLSGTGPKAGGPLYLPRFRTPVDTPAPQSPQDLPGPTGESNRWSTEPRKPVLCLGPTDADKAAQKAEVERLGGTARLISHERDLVDEPDFGAVLWWGDQENGRRLALQLARRPGPIIGLQTGQPTAADVLHERHVCIDTTASGGNAQLLAEVARDA
ncbi:bifunctional proline dehydrogenase/L-glutamate gamma-semialdehyde dehydrogenase PutA [Palleronia caenipelagi]|uniref:Bifunctional protein PutA n=1 Tax=Palleronia caenipelagi TaxID=2489174 RepID=A0A547PT82_9RHOB|nr:bifunctional proline dehydrogenase/L-glutamate gamma-semialdehyde dehydrogenase PutA [Palleronia caenipelagi]TRD17355.1 bifunctional proline dehydrogenase/L-glutamate gamma-semialdehyde dehydrogenase PutA [Palleronia caenipelagi]